MVSYVQSNRGDWKEQLGSKSKTTHKSKELLIEIEAFEQSYQIADHRAEIGRVDDEAIVAVRGALFDPVTKNGSWRANAQRCRLFARSSIIPTPTAQSRSSQC